jgi:hypothetical protein
MVIYSQVESDWILNTCFRPSDPVLVCLLNNVISAQRENIDAAASRHCSSVHFQTCPAAHLAFTSPSLVASAVHPVSQAASPTLQWPLHTLPTPSSAPCARLTSYMCRWNVLDEGSNERPPGISSWPFSKERSAELLAVHFPSNVPYLVLICQLLGLWLSKTPPIF